MLYGEFLIGIKICDLSLLWFQVLPNIHRQIIKVFSDKEEIEKRKYNYWM